jgi:glycosyltransferase involved in cell wall biosynthesis
MTTPSLGVVIPAYEPDIEQLREYLLAIEDLLDPDSILLEIDSPAPNAVTELQSLPGRVDVASRRRGKGAAITDGFERLETDILLFADADGATPVGSLVDIAEQVQKGMATLAVGSRRHPDANIADDQTLVRQLLGDGFSTLAGTLLSVTLHDYQCGAKAIHADAWNRIRHHLYEPGFAWDVELIAIAGALEFTVAEVPVEWEDQPGSTVDPVRDSARMFRALLTSRHRAKQIADDRLHTAIASRTSQPTPLVERGQEA